MTDSEIITMISNLLEMGNNITIYAPIKATCIQCKGTVLKYASNHYACWVSSNTALKDNLNLYKKIITREGNFPILRACHVVLTEEQIKTFSKEHPARFSCVNSSIHIEINNDYKLLSLQDNINSPYFIKPTNQNFDFNPPLSAVVDINTRQIVELL